MNLTSLRKSYSKLLESFKEAGVTLNESQQGNLDNFMVALEKKITETRDVAIRTTKKMVTEKLEAEYREVTESILKHMQENAELSQKIQRQVDESKQTNDLAVAVDSYLDEYLGEILPMKTIVDYSRMRKLEQVHESLKNLLRVSDNAPAPTTTEELKKDNDIEQVSETVETAQVATQDKKETETPKVEPQVVKTEPETTAEKPETKKPDANDTKKTVKESVDPKNMCLTANERIEKARKLLESKTKDLPEREARIVRESLKNASYSEINMKFKTVLESARDQIQNEADQSLQQQEKSLEEAIGDILDSKTSSKDKTVNTTDDNSENGTRPTPEDDGDIVPETEYYEKKIETLNESMDEIVDESFMKLWVSRC